MKRLIISVEERDKLKPILKWSSPFFPLCVETRLKWALVSVSTQLVTSYLEPNLKFGLG
ncbi:hypothetical protein RchiOBHm_Chr4g0392571 [Rosa chinensis]|uniref:Uncharacterized protein n=1 Tax=Rosa chinensis TaxID=74649 RepID=A0A2P6QQR8_ROSCH|nr:hypothetical protein RchiOBHm_Chr4g0392571 [Rosa chinensis]